MPQLYDDDGNPIGGDSDSLYDDGGNPVDSSGGGSLYDDNGNPIGNKGPVDLAGRSLRPKKPINPYNPVNFSDVLRVEKPQSEIDELEGNSRMWGVPQSNKAPYSKANPVDEYGYNVQNIEAGPVRRSAGKDATSMAIRAIPSMIGSYGGATAGSVVPGAGTLGGMALGGGVGSGIGEGLGQVYDWWTDPNFQGFNARQIGAQSLIGAIPFAGKTAPLVANAGKREIAKYMARAATQQGLEGGITNALATYPTAWAEGRSPSSVEVGQNALMGTALGGLVGAGMSAGPGYRYFRGKYPDSIPNAPVGPSGFHSTDPFAEREWSIPVEPPEKPINGGSQTLKFGQDLPVAEVQNTLPFDGRTPVEKLPPEPTFFTPEERAARAAKEESRWKAPERDITLGMETGQGPRFGNPEDAFSVAEAQNSLPFAVGEVAPVLPRQELKVLTPEERAARAAAAPSRWKVPDRDITLGMETGEGPRFGEGFPQQGGHLVEDYQPSLPMDQPIQRAPYNPPGEPPPLPVEPPREPAVFTGGEGPRFGTPIGGEQIELPGITPRAFEVEPPARIGQPELSLGVRTPEGEVVSRTPEAQEDVNRINDLKPEPARPDGPTNLDDYDFQSGPNNEGYYVTHPSFEKPVGPFREGDDALNWVTKHHEQSKGLAVEVPPVKVAEPELQVEPPDRILGSTEGPLLPPGEVTPNFKSRQKPLKGEPLDDLDVLPPGTFGREAEDELEGIIHPERYKHPTAKNIATSVSSLDASKAADKEYRAIIPGKKKKLGEGETWRDRAVQAINKFEKATNLGSETGAIGFGGIPGGRGGPGYSSPRNRQPITVNPPGPMGRGVSGATTSPSMPVSPPSSKKSGRSAKQKQVDPITQTARNIHGLRTTGDIAPVFRQGKNYAGRKFWWKALGQNFKSYVSEEAHQKSREALNKHYLMTPDAKYGKNADGKTQSWAEMVGLFVGSHKQEEAVAGIDFAERVLRIPGKDGKDLINPARASARAYEVLDDIRVGAADDLYKKFKKEYNAMKAAGATKEQLAKIDPDVPSVGKLIGENVNQTSGRSKLKIKERYAPDWKIIPAKYKGKDRVPFTPNYLDAEPIADALNLGLFAPRYLKSNLDQIGKMIPSIPRALASKDPATKILAQENLKQALSFLGATGAIATGNAMIGGETSTDVLKSDFGKSRHGKNITVDTTGGQGKYATLIYRALTRSKKTGKGDLVDIGPDGQFGQGDVMKLFTDLTANQVSSPAALLMAIANGEEKFDYSKEGMKFLDIRPWENTVLKNTVMPITWQNLIEIAKEDPRYIPLIFEDASGISVNVEKKKK